MSTQSAPEPDRTLKELIVSTGSGDLLELEPLDLGGGAPATAALNAERGPAPASSADRL